ncbi:MAG TPA: YqjK family protein [Rhodocyclaceae bacterium]|nr:YqjK family protein [Rhodocyclaceae bacterium]
MNPARLELALKKQRLQLQSATQRQDFARHAAALAPALGLADRARAGAAWLRRHPELPVAAAAALVVLRPHTVWRWLSRGVFAWRAARSAGRWLGTLR